MANETAKAVNEKTGRREMRAALARDKKVYNSALSTPISGSCNHRLNTEHPPTHRNCEQCWFYFFAGHKELVETTDALFQKHGPGAVSTFQGKKFEKRFLQFMSTLASWQSAMAEQNIPVDEVGESAYTVKDEQ